MKTTQVSDRNESEIFVKNDYSITFAIPADALQIRDIYAPFILENAVSFEEEVPEVEELVLRIEKAFQKHVWLVCRFNNEVAGYAYSSVHRERSAYGWVAEVSVYIHPDHRRKAIGNALYHALHEIMRAQGYVKSYPGMTIPNEASRAFHLSLGYLPFALYKDSGYKLGKWHSTEWFSYDLASSSNPPRNITPVSELGQGFFNELFERSRKLIRESNH